MNNSELKARKLVADLIDSALIGGWQLSENDEEDELIANEIRKIESDLRSITQLSESQYETYSELCEIKKREKRIAKREKEILINSQKFHSLGSPVIINKPKEYDGFNDSKSEEMYDKETTMSEYLDAIDFNSDYG